MFDVLKRITYFREIKHWSVYRLAQLSGIPQSTIATWYQKGLYPPIDKVEILCSTFGITLSEFFQTDNRNDLSESEQLLLSKWLRLNDREKSAVLEIMNVILQE